MANANDLQSLRDELTRIQTQTRRSRRLAIVGFIILILVMCCSFLYAFVQQVEATKQAVLAREQSILAEEARQQAMRSLEEARRQESIANENKAAAEKAIEDCRKGKR